MCYSVWLWARPHCTKKRQRFLWGCKDRQNIWTTKLYADLFDKACGYVPLQRTVVFVELTVSMTREIHAEAGIGVYIK